MSETVDTILRKHMETFQEPLPFSAHPFSRYAEKLEISEDEVIALLRHYLAVGAVRRVAGVLKHNRAGFTVNAMIAMEVDPALCDTAGAALAELPFITHCYRRTSYPDWPYTMYAMVHARSEEEFDSHYATIQAAVDCTSTAVLRSVKEYKKTAFRIGSR